MNGDVARSLTSHLYLESCESNSTMSDISLPFQACKNFASTLVTKNECSCYKEEGVAHYHHHHIKSLSKTTAQALWLQRTSALVTKKKAWHSIIIIMMSKACQKQLHRRSGYKVGGKGADHVLDLSCPHMVDLLT